MKLGFIRGFGGIPVNGMQSVVFVPSGSRRWTSSGSFQSDSPQKTLDASKLAFSAPSGLKLGVAELVRVQHFLKSHDFSYLKT